MRDAIDTRRLWKRLSRNLAAATDPTIPSATRKRRARHAAHFAEKLGIILRPDRCEACGSREFLEKHHTNYTLPLSISWLCDDCHTLADASGVHVDRDDGCAA